MIEQALYFAMGFLAAALAAIVILPALARRAARLYEARSRMQAPATQKQALAERDALRAHYAVECARLERRALIAEERATALRSESGRQAVGLIALKSDAETRGAELAERRAEVEALRREVRELEGALGASQTGLGDLSAQRDKALAAEAQSSGRVAELEAEASRDRARIAMLGARAERLDARLDEAARSAEAADEARARLQADLEAEAERAVRLERRLAEALAAATTLTEQASGRLEHVGALERRLAASEAQREESVIEMGRQLSRQADRDAELKAAEAKARELSALIDARERGARATETDPYGEDALRAAIERLGREVARLWAQQGAATQEFPHSDRAVRALNEG